HPHHELNPSPFTPPSPLSSLSHIYSRLLPPIPSLKPPLHPPPNQRLISILKQIKSIHNLNHYLHQTFPNKDKIIPFPHPLYKHPHPTPK
ncbi:citrate/2-methylcitrate synthase, partial [Staphylococcus epidermidis]|uniref:citrate/2-methylcitrate synthase n=1 Tax=Staphylococcus epidermidis TaxID=1282 RepID=UPI0028CB71A5